MLNRYLLLTLLFCNFFTAEASTSKVKNKKINHKYYLSAVTIFRDEAGYLDEWIHYHEMLGVEHFYLYNNLSSDDYMKVLTPHIERGLVELIEWPHEHSTLKKWYSIQMACYRDVIDKGKNDTTWLAILDSDEFIVPNKSATLTEMLREQEKYDSKKSVAAYQIGWVVFGTSNVKNIPEGSLLIELLTKHEAKPHPFFKSIVKPSLVRKVVDAHRTFLKKHHTFRQLDINTAQINHYMYRDAEFFKNVKIPRVEKRGAGIEKLLQSEANANCSDEYGQSILRFIPPLKKKIGIEDMDKHGLLWTKDGP